jgi:hypothetical protein
MGIPIFSTFERSGAGDYCLVRDTDVGGGWMTVLTAALRDAIPPALRKDGMHVFVTDVQKLYRLLPGGVWDEIPFGGSSVDPTKGTFACPGTVNVRDAVYSSAEDTVDQAEADNTKVPCVGFVYARPGALAATVQYSGELTGFTGLVTGSTYYVGLTPGAITDDVSAYPMGSVVQEVGWARNSTTLVIVIDRDWVQL